jgi:hypothetical protein
MSYAIQGTSMPGLKSIDITGLSNHNHPYQGGVDIRITPAAGGTIVSILRSEYVGKPDLYVISDQQDMGEELGKIITMACLKQE